MRPDLPHFRVTSPPRVYVTSSGTYLVYVETRRPWRARSVFIPAEVRSIPDSIAAAGALPIKGRGQP